MGMLFNTPGTNRIIELTNSAFRKPRFSSLQSSYSGSNLQTQLRALAALTAPPSAGHGLYPTASSSPLFIDFAEASLSTRWQNWLSLLDTNLDPSTNNPWSATMASAIDSALSNTGAQYSAIEFFAVPAGGISNLRVIPSHFPDHDTSGKLIQIITVQTDVVDAIFHQRDHHRGG
jgi:hypothetical protein